VAAEPGVKIAQLSASASIEHASGEAEGIRLMGQAKADAYQVGVKALGTQSYTLLQLMQAVSDGSVRVPDVTVNGNGGSGGLLDGLMAMLLRNETSKNGENGAHSPVINVKKSKSIVVETVAESPVANVHSVKSPKWSESPTDSVAKSEVVAKTDIAVIIAELSPESPAHSVAKSEDVAEDDIDSAFVNCSIVEFCNLKRGRSSSLQAFC